MHSWIKALGVTLAFAPKIVLGGILPFPAESCQSAWSESGSSDQSYLYQYNKDKDYLSYLNRLQSSDKNRKNCHKTWTVLVYMSATQDLIPYAFADLLEMEAAHSIADPLATHSTGSSIRSDLVVQLSMENDLSVSRLHMFESPEDQSKNLSKEDVSRLVRKQIYSPVVAEFARPTPASEAKLFEDFLKWGIEEYPSEYYFVIIWGHGQGWTSIESNVLNKLPQKDNIKVAFTGRYGGLALDGESNYLDIPSLRGVLKKVKKWTGEPVAVFASDACLMQSVEDGHELADCTQYICGSEDIESYAGFPYGNVLSQLNSGVFHGASSRAQKEELSQSEPFLVAWMIPQLYKDSFDPTQGTQGNLDPTAFQDLTGCSISSKHLKTTLVPALNLLGNALINFVKEEDMRWIDLKELVQRGPFFQGGTQDLGSFLKGLSEVLAADIQYHNNGATQAAALLRQAIWRTYSALNYTVVNAVLGEDYPKFNHKSEIGPRGISIWLPQSDDDFVSRFEDFSRSRFWSSAAETELPGWKNWLMKMYPAGLAKALTLRMHLQ
jgi:hypothetical protein